MSVPGAADAVTPGSAHDPLPEALTLARGAASDGLGLKLLGGLAVRVLCPDYPPRLRRDQVLFTYLHLAASRECTDALLRAGAHVQVDVQYDRRKRPSGPERAIITGGRADYAIPDMHRT